MKDRTAAEKPRWGRRLVVILAVCFVLFAVFLPLVLTSQPSPSPTAGNEESPELVVEAPQVRQVSLHGVEEKAAVEPAVFQFAPSAAGDEKAPAFDPSEAVVADPPPECRCCAPAKTWGVASCRTIVRTRCRPIRRCVVRCRRY